MMQRQRGSCMQMHLVIANWSGLRLMHAIMHSVQGCCIVALNRKVRQLRQLLC